MHDRGDRVPRTLSQPGEAPSDGTWDTLRSARFSFFVDLLLFFFVGFDSMVFLSD